MAKFVCAAAPPAPAPALRLQSPPSAVATPPSYALRPSSLRFRIRSSFSDYPLASKIIIRNLPYTAGENYLQKEFSRFGEIAEVTIAMDERTKGSKGYAFIQYTSQENAMLALEHMDYKYFDGRRIHVELAKPCLKNFGRYPKTCGRPSEELPIQQENQ